MNDKINEAVIVAYGRSPIARAFKGTLSNVYPTELGAQILRAVVEKVPELPVEAIDDVIIGCAKPERAQGKNMARIIALASGLPNSAPAKTVNRFCASGLESIALAAQAIKAGEANIVIAGGVESMTMVRMEKDEMSLYDPKLIQERPDIYLPMGMTAENVADKYGITRAEMDSFSLDSQRKAAKAQDDGCFKKEIIPVKLSEGVFDTDECIRKDTTLEGLGQLKTVFKEDGNVTAGTSSPMSDGAAFVIMMDRRTAQELAIKPIARFIGYAVTGVDPDIMGIGPVKAIPKVMSLTGLSLEQMDTIELNEAFAAQAIACIRELGIDTEKLNPRGGAIALGHPLGMTGTALTIKAMSYLEDTGKRYGLISMCIGGGMGAAGIIEML
ncbi:MAG: thiolase family protein [Lachnospiraceae bacterium]